MDWTENVFVCWDLNAKIEMCVGVEKRRRKKRGKKEEKTAILHSAFQHEVSSVSPTLKE